MNAGATLADLHNSWNGYTPKSVKSRNYLTEYERFFQNESFFVDNFENGKEVIDLAKDLYDFARLNDTKEIIHNDFRSQNIFIEENSFDVKLILDFDWSCLGNNLKDISHSMIEWSMPDGVKVPRLELAQAFLDGYKSKRNINSSLEEYKKWAVFACLSDALNYWIDNKDDQSKVLRSYMYGKAKSVIRGDYDTIII
jgi:Ser/Thr protein kinase RdoA (MazF antagonist)